jgi:hypothetical protein
VDLVTGVSKVGQSVLRMIGDEGRLELRSWLQTGLRVAEHLSGLTPGRHDGLPAYSDALAEGSGPAGHVHAASSPTVEATSAEIRAWARQHDLAVGDRGVIAKRVIEAYALAHAS